ncbi:uncharacterized protein TrAFT101_010408 [Trichoderma asperellum]|uniref:uncharacterized protein n=1 Tax=Trichoderma asperellum TaxID=101201 RepID=UPI0033235E00|nr:hypothetical protein TrAFT101_010408 [Trichoderma asperellum]
MAQPGVASLDLTGREGSRIHWLNRHVGLTGLTRETLQVVCQLWFGRQLLTKLSHLGRIRFVRMRVVLQQRGQDQLVCPATERLGYRKAFHGFFAMWRTSAS